MTETTYICPQNIQDMFEDNEQTKAKARKLALDRYCSLNANIGDKIYLPEIGWLEKKRMAES